MKNINIQLQNEANECGLACISMIASAYESNFSLKHLRDVYKLSKDGMSLFDIIKVFDDVGFSTNCYELEVNHLSDIKLPAILFWNNSHFVVLEKSGINYTIIDPAFGRRYYTKKEVNLFFSGIALEIDEKKFQYNIEENKKTVSPFGFSNLLQNYPAVTGLFLSNVLMLLVCGLLSIFIPKMFPLIMNEVLPSNDTDNLYLILIIFCGIFFANSFVIFLSSYTKYQISKYLNNRVSQDYFSLMMSLPVIFFDRRMPAQVIRYVSAVQSISRKLTDGWSSILVYLLTSFIFALLLLNTEFIIGSILIVSSLIFLTVRVLIINVMKNYHNKLIVLESDRNQSIIDTFNNINSVKINCTEYKKVFDFSQKQNLISSQNARVHLLSESGTNLHTSMNLFQGIAVAYFGTMSVLSGVINIGDLIAIVLFKDMFMHNILEATEKYNNLRLLDTEIEQSLDVIEHSRNSELPMTDIKTAYINQDELIGDISIKNLTFSYSSFDSEPIIKDLSLYIPYGSKLLIRGSSGCGKSTLLKLIATLDKVDSGVITYNGLTADSFGLRALRDKIAIVGFDDKIENCTLIENIVSDSYDIDVKRVKSIVNKLGLNFVSELPAGYQTRLGIGGHKLSLGQQQRIFLARALYKQPQLLILDEPTSHLDPVTSDLIKRVIKNLSCTVIIVSHDENEVGYDNEITFR
ncbi:peptidase domain-containing ABC transporter [Photobacterium leiognathi]|uniref:peptidase domain-containing ABC transporter n=1 Tax=Photobacterium leiognathi TaxID=553611 RepID=UPI002982B224|nr:cysteine peptidase family C39 domain-containing protein [Photobacterium leiognathi]